MYCAALRGLPGAMEITETSPLHGTASAPAAAPAPTRAISGAMNDVGDSAKAGTVAMSAFGGAIDVWMCIVSKLQLHFVSFTRSAVRIASSAQ